MELKVWVDGIQRVVCGASYTTTCQDVVLALAHAMGRIGRFTLVEKWRDSERPLTPGECPLQALHKWGEYAAEVRFYLVQAETEKVKNKSQNQQRPKTPTEKLDTFSHNFSPPTPQYQPNQMSNTDSLKRSSTFSGAHNQYATFPSSSLSSSMSATLSGYNRSQQPPVQPPPSSNAKVRRTTQSSLPNGEMASTSSSGSSPRSSSRTSPRGLPPGYTSRGNIPTHYPSAPHPSNAYRGDARELHPANMPEASSSYSNQGSDYSSRRPHPSHTGPPYSVPSQQAYSAYSQPAAVGHPHTKQPQQPYPPSFDQTSSHPSVPSSYHRPPPQQHTQPLPSGKPYSSQQLRPPSSHEPYSQSGASQPQQPYIQSGGPQPPPSHPVPAPRHQRPPSPSAEYENLPPYNRGRQRPSSRDPPHPVRRERSRDRSLPRAMPSNQANTGGFYQGDNRGGIDSAYREELPRRPSSNPNQFQGFGKENRPGDYPVQKDRNLLGHPDNRSANQSSQGRGRPADAFKHPSDSMPVAAQPSTRSRSMPEPQASKGLPTRSVSSYDTAARDDGGLRHSGDKPLSKSMPASGMNLLRQSGEANKISFVDSALHRQQKSSTDSNQSGGSKGGGGGMSSFASAVAHLRQHSGEGQHLKPVKTETHVRQHSSDSSRTDESFKGGLGNTGRNFSASGGGNSVGVNNMRSFSTESDHQQKENVQRLHPPSNQPLSSFTSPRPGSAFTQVSPRTSRQGSSSSPSSAPVAYNLDHQNLNQFRSGVSSAETDNHLKQESSHSRQASLEIEEYDLDQNFPDVLQREASAGMSGRVDRRYNVPMEYHLDNGGVAPAAPAQVETEYLQLMRLVKMQQEKIKVQEAQINEATAEISSLEEKESQDNAQLEVITGQLSQLEQQEAEVKVALEDLERVEWVNVLDGERKREADIRLQMKNTQGKVEQLDSQLKQLKEEEEKKGQEVKAELDKLEKEKKQNEELEKKTTEELNNLRNKLAALNKEVEEKGRKLEDIEEMIQKAENDTKKQEEEAKSIEEELKDENMKDFQAHPVPKEPPPTSVAGQAPVVPPAPLTVISSTDDGEAILKLLEGRLSPRTPPISPTADGNGANVEGITSAQHTYKSALAAKNPNGVWV